MVPGAGSRGVPAISFGFILVTKSSNWYKNVLLLSNLAEINTLLAGFSLFQVLIKPSDPS